jgi:putative pyruvate formate lyase activating enzyme
VLEAVPRGLKIPLVYNTNSYDSIKTLKELDGIISIYLPDLKYAADTRASKLSRAMDYVKHSRRAIKEMFRQVGELVVDETGVAQKGLIVRHPILPNGLAGSRQSLTWLANEVSSKVTVSLMSQYHPTHRAHKYPLLARPISISEYEEVLGIMDGLELSNGWKQEMGARRIYLPDFERQGHPFLIEH